MTQCKRHFVMPAKAKKADIVCGLQKSPLAVCEGCATFVLGANSNPAFPAADSITPNERLMWAIDRSGPAVLQLADYLQILSLLRAADKFAAFNIVCPCLSL